MNLSKFAEYRNSLQDPRSRTFCYPLISLVVDY